MGQVVERTVVEEARGHTVDHHRLQSPTSRHQSWTSTHRCHFGTFNTLFPIQHVPQPLPPRRPALLPLLAVSLQGHIDTLAISAHTAVQVQASNLSASTLIHALTGPWMADTQLPTYRHNLQSPWGSRPYRLYQAIPFSSLPHLRALLLSCDVGLQHLSHLDPHPHHRLLRPHRAGQFRQQARQPRALHGQQMLQRPHDEENEAARGERGMAPFAGWRQTSGGERGRGREG